MHIAAASFEAADNNAGAAAIADSALKGTDLVILSGVTDVTTVAADNIDFVKNTSRGQKEKPHCVSSGVFFVSYRTLFNQAYVLIARLIFRSNTKHLRVPIASTKQLVGKAHGVVG